MAKASKKKKRPIGPNLEATSIVEDAASENPIIDEPTTQDHVKNLHAIALGRLGGLKGGQARAQKLDVNILNIYTFFMTAVI
jgi:hypothetical protein